MPVQMYSLADFTVELATTGGAPATVEASCVAGTLSYDVETNYVTPPATACDPFPAMQNRGTRRSVTLEGVADEAEATSVVDFLEDHSGQAGTITLEPIAAKAALLPTIVFPVAGFVEASIAYPADDTATISTEAMYLTGRPTRTPAAALVAAAAGAAGDVDDA